MITQKDLGWSHEDLPFDWEGQFGSNMDQLSADTIEAFLEKAPPYKFRPGDLVKWGQKTTSGKLIFHGIVRALDIDVNWSRVEFSSDPVSCMRWAYHVVVPPETIGDGFDEVSEPYLTLAEHELTLVKPPFYYKPAPGTLQILPQPRLPLWTYGRISDLRLQINALIQGEVELYEQTKLDLHEESLWHW